MAIHKIPVCSRTALVLALLVLLAAAPARAQQTVNLQAQKDNTLFNDPLGQASNGAGDHFFAGNTNQNEARRGLIRFNLGIIPAGATITNARLTLYMSRSQAGDETIAMHRVLADWGEGASNAGGGEGSGAPAAPGDATWLARYFGSSLWSTPGGDYDPIASESENVGGIGSYSWSGPGLIADVQQWVDDPASNFGWLLRGEESGPRAAKRFDSRTNPTANRRPVLSVTFTPPAGPVGACCLDDGSCIVTSSGACASQGGAYSGDGSTCDPSPCPPPPMGACCQTGGVCSILSAANCAGVAGIYQGDNTTCGGSPCPLTLQPFVDALQIPGIAQPTTGQAGGAATYRIEVLQAQLRLHRDLPFTTIWGYNGSYPGPTIEARINQPVTVTWVNGLRNSQGQFLSSHYLPVDPCLHGPDMTGNAPIIVTHLHGGKVPEGSDGFPEDHFAAGQQSAPYLYPNAQRAATLWYHDHALGLTRLNVYMGLAGMYILRDAAEGALGLPSGRYEVPLVIQDRSFNNDGSLKYPSDWQEHFFGDFILVNGKVWPFFVVDRGLYRFRVLNGSGSRVYTLSLSTGASFRQIGTDGGLLPSPVTLSALTIAPGERADIVIDFGSLSAGSEVTLLNSAPAPFPDGDPVHDVPNVMKFIVGPNAGFTDPLPGLLSPVTQISESQSVLTRDFILAQTTGAAGNGASSSRGAGQCSGVLDSWTINGLLWDDITEFPRLNTTETWRFINRSPTMHPMHIHLVQFQVLDRQAFFVEQGAIVPTGPVIPPQPNELGWKDTVQCPPGQITRVIHRYEAHTGTFVYHCHTLEHEDSEMMRQFTVRPTCNGDANDDGAVNFFDVASVLSSFGATVPPYGLGDANGTGAVNFADVAAVLSAFGAVCQ